MKQIYISVVVITYNRAEMLRNALESLICQQTESEFSFEIVVVDNASTDATKVVVQNTAASSKVPIRYVFEENIGLAQARNRGVKESYGEWIAFFDDDQLAEPNWLKELLMFAVQTGADCVGGAVNLYLCEQELSQLSLITRSLLGETVGRNIPERCGRKRMPGTGNVLIKSTVFAAVGPLENSPRGGEDLRFLNKVRMAGLEVWYTPNAVVHHVIPRCRLEDDYLFLNSLRWGDINACLDHKEWGLKKTILACIARIGQALLVNVPSLLWTQLLGYKAEALGRKCLLWRAIGYTRQTIFLIGPRAFAQESYFARLEYRKERKLFISDMELSKSDSTNKEGPLDTDLVEPLN